jgi:hypothetical protein
MFFRVEFFSFSIDFFSILRYFPVDKNVLSTFCPRQRFFSSTFCSSRLYSLSAFCPIFLALTISTLCPWTFFTVGIFLLQRFVGESWKHIRRQYFLFILNLSMLRVPSVLIHSGSGNCGLYSVRIYRIHIIYFLTILILI